MTDGGAGLTVLVRRHVRARPERLFEAWTTSEQLLRWWGPEHVECTAAEVDLRIGGRYRLGNRLPDGTVLWIEGEFEQIEPPRLLVYSWRLGATPISTERVTVRFEPRGDGTEIVILHERIPDAATRDTHERGWRGCLGRLTAFLG